MAANPPPYPPPWSERDARRQARDFARAQRDQMRAQRHYWRHWYGYRRVVDCGPVHSAGDRHHRPAARNRAPERSRLLELVCALVAHAADWRRPGIAREYFWDRNNPYAGRRSVGGVVFLILLLAAVGWGSNEGRWWGPFSHQFNDDGDDFFSMMGEEHDNDVQIDQEIPSNANVNIQNPRGDVTVTTSTDGEMHLRAHQVVHSLGQGCAEDVR